MEITGGRLQLGAMPPLGGELEPLGRVVVDCQQVRPGDVYWSLDRGAGDDAFPEEAFARSALGVVTAGRRVEPWAGKFAIQVEDSRAALRQLVRAVRCRFTGFVVAVAGHTGKTTTAAWIEAALAARGPGFRPDASSSAKFDPRTLLELTAEHRFGVFEMSADVPVEFTEQAQWISPHGAVLVNAADAWDDSPDVARAADQIQALRDALPSHGTLVVNGDDEVLARALPRSSDQILRIGRSTRCDWSASHIKLSDGWLGFVVDGTQLCVRAAGRHQLIPALAAYAVGRLAGIPAAELARRLADVESPHRTCRMASRQGITVLADWPRSRPAAARAALAALRDFPAQGRRIVVAGDMFRDHVHRQQITRQYGDAAVAGYGADMIVSYGPTAECLIASARAAGLSQRHTTAVSRMDEAAECLRNWCQPGDAVLVTGSTADESEELAKRLLLAGESAAA